MDDRDVGRRVREEPEQVARHCDRLVPTDLDLQALRDEALEKEILLEPRRLPGRVRVGGALERLAEEAPSTVAGKSERDGELGLLEVDAWRRNGVEQVGKDRETAGHGARRQRSASNVPGIASASRPPYRDVISAASFEARTVPLRLRHASSSRRGRRGQPGRAACEGGARKPRIRRFAGAARALRRRRTGWRSRQGEPGVPASDDDEPHRN